MPVPISQNVIELGTTAGLRFVEVSAVLLSALSGMIVAARKRMDLVGTYSLAIVTAFGGGTVRDILLDRRPLFWVTYWPYLVVVLALCILFVYSRSAYESARKWERRFDIIDAIGMALFGLSGANLGLLHGSPLFVSVLYGVITASLGGVLRDVLSSEVPTLFRVGALHATAVFIGCAIFVGLRALGAQLLLASGVGFAVIVLLRLLSLWRGIVLPSPHWLRELQKTGEFPTSSS